MDPRGSDAPAPTTGAVHAWRRIDERDGYGAARIAADGSGWTAHGCEVLVEDPMLACWFRVDLDQDWRTVRARVDLFGPAGVAALDLAADADRRWTVDGDAEPTLDGCLDVDVAATPLTNTFPLRRLARLPVGETRTVAVAWVEVPALRVFRMEQTYHRLAARQWGYSDPQYGAFVLDVDDDGVVERYEGFAERAGRPPVRVDAASS